MSIYISNDLIDVDDQSVNVHPEGVIGVDAETAIINNISKDIHFEWQNVRKLSGRERYLALCKKLGLNPKR